jgi:hypothetical protein
MDTLFGILSALFITTSLVAFLADRPEAGDDNYSVVISFVVLVAIMSLAGMMGILGQQGMATVMRENHPPQCSQP